MVCLRRRSCSPRDPCKRNSQGGILYWYWGHDTGLPWNAGLYRNSNQLSSFWNDQIIQNRRELSNWRQRKPVGLKREQNEIILCDILTFFSALLLSYFLLESWFLKKSRNRKERKLTKIQFNSNSIISISLVALCSDCSVVVLQHSKYRDRECRNTFWKHSESKELPVQSVFYWNHLNTPMQYVFDLLFFIKVMSEASKIEQLLKGWQERRQ